MLWAILDLMVFGKHIEYSIFIPIDEQFYFILKPIFPNNPLTIINRFLFRVNPNKRTPPEPDPDERIDKTSPSPQIQNPQILCPRPSMTICPSEHVDIYPEQIV